jgi:hypothetical protein
MTIWAKSGEPAHVLWNVNVLVWCLTPIGFAIVWL